MSKPSIIKTITRKRGARSFGGNVTLFIFLTFMALLYLFPVIFMANNAFKPLSEQLKFPPDIFVNTPTLENFMDLGELFSNSLVPFSRHLFNTLFVVAVGTAGQVVFASMAAYPLAKFDFAGNEFLSKIIVLSLMFTTAVTSVPNYVIMSRLGLVDTYLALILPAFSSSLGLYLMKNFMTQVPSSLIEAAHIDGASEMLTLWGVVMPAVKPAWITLLIFSFQSMWGVTGNIFIYKESLKPISYALQQIASVGIARQGVTAAVSLIMFLIPITLYIFMQSNVLETMSTSGMKD
ncbi:MAG: carbohydrate ABC transporter permease [Clostridiales bacterium]|jgi:ABC-type glycerol-3-phosphate transport system permease component|nr:carbohydrate ABC transporter permease [Clostridiales bacterium]